MSKLRQPRKLGRTLRNATLLILMLRATTMVNEIEHHLDHLL